MSHATWTPQAIFVPSHDTLRKMTISSNVWLVGAGGMARDYMSVLSALQQPVIVIGRGRISAAQLESECGHRVVTGGLEAFLEDRPVAPVAAIVAVGIEALGSTTLQLLRAGVSRVLVEKPGALRKSEIQALQAEAESRGAEVVIGYNRRMYAATLAAQRMIEEDGGVQSLHFEFTEWGHLIEPLVKAPGVKDAWLLANSSHVIDLAFHLGGEPERLHALIAGGLTWHPNAAIFAGAGCTLRGALFSYQANWGAPGRWGLEVLTSQRRLIFRPMESLQIMRRGAVTIESVVLDDQIDKVLKPGLYEQVRRFLSGDFTGLCSLQEQIRHWPWYELIGGYATR